MTQRRAAHEFVMPESPNPNAEEIALGAKLFGHLKVTSEPIELLPSGTKVTAWSAVHRL